jgi:RNA polymerase subunit RPABC4/transcription elongation factor Spt4
VSIYGDTTIVRQRMVEGRQQVCPECGYAGQDCSSEVDVCGSCKEVVPADHPDECPHCGDANCMMQACPECHAQLELDYERMEPWWTANRGFRRFEKMVATLTCVAA